MSVKSLDQVHPTPPQTSLSKIWDNLTQPAATLQADDQQKARLLSAIVIVVLPFGLLTIFASPFSQMMRGAPVIAPPFGSIFGIALIPLAYLLSRTKYYAIGARVMLSIPLFGVLLPLIPTQGYSSVNTLFFLTLSIIGAGLLLSSRETLFIGIAIVGIILLIPRSPSANVNVSAITTVITAIYALTVTCITVLVGRVRERNLRDLEQRQIELSRSLIETDKSRAQAEASRERAERSDKVKSAFLASMSHELRTPLNAIINFTEFVAAGDTGPVNDEQKDLLQEVVNSGKHLLNLINDVLDMSKIEAGSLNLFIEDNINLKSILDSSISTCRGLVKDGVQLQTDIPDTLSTIRGDRQRLMQILLNILSNACKFTDKGHIKLSASTVKDEILISIADTGVGISPEDQATVFEAFKQTTTGLRQGGGTGLGMPIARSLAEAHGGRLWLESQVGKGSTFHVALPIKSQTLTPVI